MRIYSWFFFCLFLFSCKGKDNARHLNKPAVVHPSASPAGSFRPLWDSTNQLLPEVQMLQLKYIVFGCWCAPWRVISDSPKSKSDSTSLNKTIWLEPAASGLYDPEMDSTFLDISGTILVKGQFYERDDYPRGTYEMEEHADKARVFRYTWIKAIKRKRS